MRHGARGDGQTKALVQEGGDLGVRESEMLIENADERDGLRAKMGRGRAQCIRGLQRMTPLQTSTAVHTLTDVYIKASDNRLHDGRFLDTAGRRECA